MSNFDNLIDIYNNKKENEIVLDDSDDDDDEIVLNESDDDSEYEDEAGFFLNDNVNNNVNNKIDNNINNKEDNVLISTEGISEEDNIVSNYVRSKNLKKCDVCQRYYSLDMIVDPEGLDSMCWHCLFWMNYDITCRKDVDGNLGMCIADYIYKCEKDHNMEICTKRTDQGGCFLCEYKLGYILSDIKDIWKIYDLDKINDNQVELEIKDENDYLSDIDEEIMTVYI